MRFRHQPFDVLMNELDRMMFTDYFPYKPETGVLSLREGSSEQLTPYKHPSLDVKEENDEIKISVDLPGIEKEAIKLRLVNPRLLELSCEKKSEFEDKKENYYVKERAYGYMKRMIALPSDVTELDMKSEFKNGVLDLKFKKIEITKKEYLRLE